MSSLCQNPERFICILYQNIIFRDSASYFLEMSMLINLVGTLTQLRMEVGCITFPGMGPGGVNMPSLCQCPEWWTSAGKELTTWLSACAVLPYAVLIFCVPFPYGIGEGGGTRLYRFLTIAFSSTFRPLITVLGFSCSYFLKMVKMPVR